MIADSALLKAELLPDDNRIGRFRATRHFLCKFWRSFLPHNSFVVVDVTWIWPHEVGEFVAFSPFFDVIAEGSAIPEYQITFSREEDGKTTVKAERLKTLLKPPA